MVTCLLWCLQSWDRGKGGKDLSSNSNHPITPRFKVWGTQSAQPAFSPANLHVVAVVFGGCGVGCWVLGVGLHGFVCVEVAAVGQIVDICIVWLDVFQRGWTWMYAPTYPSKYVSVSGLFNLFSHTRVSTRPTMETGVPVPGKGSRTLQLTLPRRFVGLTSRPTPLPRVF